VIRSPGFAAVASAAALRTRSSTCRRAVSSGHTPGAMPGPTQLATVNHSKTYASRTGWPLCRASSTAQFRATEASVEPS
jgi:hypothetical protein